MRNKIIYIFSWSVLLLIATFPDMFRPAAADTSANDRDYLLPLLFAVLLAGIDVVYTYLAERDKGNTISLLGVYVWTLVFIAALIMGLFYTCQASTVASFCVAWVSLTGMKFAVTGKSGTKRTELRTVSEE